MSLLINFISPCLKVKWGWLVRLSRFINCFSFNIFSDIALMMNSETEIQGLIIAAITES